MKSDVYDYVTERIIDRLEQGEVPWINTRTKPLLLARSATTGSSRAALLAGYQPAMIPTALETKMESRIYGKVILSVAPKSAESLEQNVAFATEEFELDALDLRRSAKSVRVYSG